MDIMELNYHEEFDISNEESYSVLRFEYYDGRLYHCTIFETDCWSNYDEGNCYSYGYTFTEKELLEILEIDSNTKIKVMDYDYFS